MQTRPHPMNPAWESREDFTILCRGCVMDFSRRFTLPRPDGTRGIEMKPARFHWECWNEKLVPDGYDAYLPSSSAPPKPAMVKIRKHATGGNIGNQRRAVILTIPVSISKKDRRLAPMEDDIEVSEADGVVNISKPGVYNMKVLKEEIVAQNLDRHRIAYNLTQLRARITMRAEKRGNNLHKTQARARKQRTKRKTK